jgi:hypothetical protein
MSGVGRNHPVEDHALAAIEPQRHALAVALDRFDAGLETDVGTLLAQPRASIVSISER